ncbi:uncharacterized protein LOC144142510 isoform X2 [Haemaphysalis longicornis]
MLCVFFQLTQSKQNRRFDARTLPETPFVPDAPTDLTFDVSCQNQGLITWKHQSHADGFLFGLCPEGDATCLEQKIDASARKHEFQLHKSDASYKIYLWAFNDFFVLPLYSDPAATQFSSYPKVLHFKSLHLTPLNYSAIQATWEENWAHEINFTVCRLPKDCKTIFVLGTLKQLTFGGLAPNTTYTISAQAQVKLNNKTCEGAAESRTARTFPIAPGPVLNLKYEILKSVFLNAGWDAPWDTAPVDGYTVECRDIEGAYDVGEDVFEKTFVNVTIDLRKFASTFNCSVWAFIDSSHHGRVNGTKILFEVATHDIDPPVDLKVMVQCKNEADIAWNYELGVPITGFVAKVCWINESSCENRILPAPAKELSYRLKQFSALYNVSVVAYVNDSLQTVYSRSTKAKCFSFPKVPDLDDAIVSALSSTALRAVWKEEWDHEIAFLVCTTPYNCQSRRVPGALQQYTFTGLRPDTKYNVYAQAEVALYNKTCKGALQNRSASTFPEASGTVSNFKYKVVKSVFLNASWEAPNENKPVDGYTIKCRDLKGPFEVVQDVFVTNVSLPLRKFASRFNCSVWAFINVSHHQRVNGTKTVFELATHNIERPMDVNVAVQCKNDATITWEYDLRVEITGFLANLCWLNRSLCENRTLSPTTREMSYQLQGDGALYSISLLAYLDDSLQAILSQPTTAKFFSFPKLPEVHSLFLTPLNYSAIQATWKEEWSHEIKFRVCNPLRKCEENVVFGTLQQHTFNGLAADSTYMISAQTMVTLNNKTCQGIPQYRTTRTVPKPPGPVSKLSYEIVNSVFLYADWDAPNDTTPVDGYRIKCQDVEGPYGVSLDVSATKTSVNVTIPLRKFASTFNCSVWAFIYSRHHGRVNGTKTVFEVTTNNLEPPVDVRVNVQCQNKARATWNYEPRINITGFVAKLCWMNKSICINKTLPAVAREVSHRLQEYNALYTISVDAYIDDSVQTTHSRPTARKFLSFPKMAGLEDVSITALSSTALRAVWKAEWDHEIQFNVCTTPYDCKSYVVPGTLLEHTFRGLQPDTLYKVSAQAEVTLNNRTCKGTQQSHSVCTLAEVPPRDVKLVERTATSLTYSWIADPTAPECNITVLAEEQSAYSAIAEYGDRNNRSVAHNITNLTPWTTYNVSIMNCRPTFCSEPTYVRSTTNVAAPSQVQDLKYSIVEDVQVRLTWKKPEHPNGPIEGYSVVVFNEDQQDRTMYNVGGHLNGTTIDLECQFNVFNISVEAYNVDKERNGTICGSSSEVEFETLGDGPMPPRPKVGAVAEDTVHLSWEMPEDPRYNITGFNISVSHRPPFVTRKHNFTITSLEPWTEYNVSVSSCTNATECGQEYGRHFKTDVGEPSEPVDLKAGSASKNWLLVEWEPPKVRNGPLSGYNVTFKKGDGEVQETTTQLSYNLTGLSAGTPYKVSVYAFNDGLTTTKRGPGTTILVLTESEKTSATITLLSIFIPLTLLLALVAGVFLYKRYQKRIGDREQLTTAEGH